MVRCPGQDLRFWKLDDIFDVNCSHCGTAVEFWKDEPSVKCPNCRKVVVNPKLDLGCAQWCQYAQQCLGALLEPQGTLCKKLIREMKAILGPDERKIDHALAVFRNAQQILESEKGDARAVSAAALLHTVGAPCPNPDGTRAGDCENNMRRSTVHEILAKCAVDAASAERICTMIAGHSSGTVSDDVESKILWDAEWLARLADDWAGANAVERTEFVERTFRTEKGRELAAALLNSR
jgi:HD superfamily phosphodiesterase